MHEQCERHAKGTQKRKKVKPYLKLIASFHLNMEYGVSVLGGPLSVMQVSWPASKFKATSYYSVHPAILSATQLTKLTLLFSASHSSDACSTSSSQASLSWNLATSAERENGYKTPESCSSTEFWRHLAPQSSVAALESHCLCNQVASGQRKPNATEWRTNEANTHLFNTAVGCSMLHPILPFSRQHVATFATKSGLWPEIRIQWASQIDNFPLTVHYGVFKQDLV